MTQWEYRKYTCSMDYTGLVKEGMVYRCGWVKFYEELEKLGLEGWELVSAYAVNTSYTYHLFKRRIEPIQSKAPSIEV